MKTKINNTEIMYKVDYIKGIVHLSDLDRPHRMTITNSIDPTWQALLIKQEGLLQSVLDFQWIIYHTDDLISEYKDYNFKFANKNDPRIDPEFLKIATDGKVN